MNLKNPYLSPRPTDSDAAALVAESPTETLGSIAKQTFFAWEKLRLIYVAILGVETILIGLTGDGAAWDPGFWLIVILCAMVANVCFFAGPILETYVRWLGFPTKALRWVLFIAGTLFTGLLAMVCLVELLPTPN